MVNRNVYIPPNKNNKNGTIHTHTHTNTSSLITMESYAHRKEEKIAGFFSSGFFLKYREQKISTKKRTNKKNHHIHLQIFSLKQTKEYKRNRQTNIKRNDIFL
eukprot:GEMP01080387.1.p1 GENE.GEMP01080387.1~~GEMP01080387.1.p1  ORF type:complete len:103 (-),score=0.83 GEMP01080387.1:342-650(-)